MFKDKRRWHRDMGIWQATFFQADKHVNLKNLTNISLLYMEQEFPHWLKYSQTYAYFVGLNASKTMQI